MPALPPRPIIWLSETQRRKQEQEAHRMDKIKGVNLGNWLVLEKWMQPDFFAGTNAEDEIWMYRNLDRETAFAKVKAHRDTYVTEADFAEIAGHGLNLLRIPVPYFIFGDREGLPGCLEYLDQAFDWAEKYGLKVMIDLHTVPGSQNGYDNGGLTGVCKWYKNPGEVEFVLTVLERLSQRYAKREGLFGIEVLNEPISFMVWISSPSRGKAADKAEAKGSWYVPLRFLQSFYLDAYRRMRACLPEDKAIIFHDGFRLNSWKRFFRDNQLTNVFLDTHIYIFAMEMFVPIHRPWVYQLYTDLYCRALEKVNRYVPVIVGEWTLSNRYAVNEADPARRRRNFQEIAQIQADAWSAGAGWIYWNYQLLRKQSAPFDEAWKESWDMRRCWKNGWFPEKMI